MLQDTESPDQLSQRAIEALVRERIFFAHQSVGANVLDGLRSLASSAGVDGLEISSIEGNGRVSTSGILEATVGKNGDPSSKISDFKALIRRVAPSKPQIALMKFCYVDYSPTTDVESVFREYKEAMAELEQAFPSIRFLHATVPLTARMLSIKDRIKVLLGRDLWEDRANAKRQRFNDLLRKTFPTERLVDIAKMESTRIDGTQSMIEIEGERVPCMDKSYTDDGGHLNSLGQKVVATGFAEAIGRNLR